MCRIHTVNTCGIGIRIRYSHSGDDFDCPNIWTEMTRECNFHDLNDLSSDAWPTVFSVFDFSVIYRFDALQLQVSIWVRWELPGNLWCMHGVIIFWRWYCLLNVFSFGLLEMTNQGMSCSYNSTVGGYFNHPAPDSSKFEVYLIFLVYTGCHCDCEFGRWEI